VIVVIYVLVNHPPGSGKKRHLQGRAVGLALDAPVAQIRRDARGSSDMVAPGVSFDETTDGVQVKRYAFHADSTGGDNARPLPKRSKRMARIGAPFTGD